MNQDPSRVVEQIVVLRCQAGDDAAFETLMASHGPRIRYFVRRLATDAGEIEDLLQEIWITVWRKVPRLRDSASFRPWLYRIARNVVYKHQRRSGHQPSFDAPEITGDATEIRFDPEDVAAIHASLGRLSEPHREALTLRFLEDMSYEEMADALECPVGTVRSRIFYAKKALREIIEKEGR